MLKTDLDDEEISKYCAERGIKRGRASFLAAAKRDAVSRRSVFGVFRAVAITVVVWSRSRNRSRE